ncbi:MBL fold metallo-hydrolase [Actinophytocola sp.]|uniref:MBL fold metallo-hydrolase n=1 Tax=Actinophytocola sp. TaxID=1872138 RepID=UPI002D74604B|nr:MBL fold metallo-hydrolase [Actinophytocola sp.]HYQ67025.1 MBL fold metallo-hydrolase [Actinophytocola sp.]
MVDFLTGAPVAGDLDVRWNHGSRSVRRNSDPPIQVHAYDDHTFVLRQNKAVHYEAPFLFLFCGNDRAFLLDTGATEDPARFPLRATVDALLDGWLAEHPRVAYELVVAHTHGHGDHIAGDGQFDGRPHTTVVPAALASVQAYFGITDWPTGVARLDLGGRVLEVTGCPGHHEASIAIYDPWTGFLLTGDTVLPGRLYVQDLAMLRESLHRLVAFAHARPVTHVMGCHIEMSRRRGRDYPIGATYQPEEPPLQMTVAQLVNIRDATERITRPGVHVFDDFIVFHAPSRREVLRYRLRAFWSRLRTRMADYGLA